MSKSRKIMYSKRTTVNSVLYTGNSTGKKSSGVLTQKKITIQNNGYVKLLTVAIIVLKSYMLMDTET
jgi:hypothetical protein